MRGMEPDVCRGRERSHLSMRGKNSKAMRSLKPVLHLSIRISQLDHLLMLQCSAWTLRHNVMSKRLISLIDRNAHRFLTR